MPCLPEGYRYYQERVKHVVRTRVHHRPGRACEVNGGDDDEADGQIAQYVTGDLWVAISEWHLSPSTKRTSTELFETLCALPSYEIAGEGAWPSEADDPRQCSPTLPPDPLVPALREIDAMRAHQGIRERTESSAWVTKWLTLYELHRNCDAVVEYRLTWGL